MQIDNIQQLTLCITLFNMGLFGGFLHCSSMCSPFVIHQVSARLKNQSIEDFQGFSRIKDFALLPYHFGRIFTYAIIGTLCSYFASNLRDLENFKIFSAIMLISAAILMAMNVFKKNIINFSYFSKFFNIFPKITLFKKILANLFDNPTSYRGFILGVILGFLPCGLLYSAFIIAASISNIATAFLAMTFFGIATFPALFLVAWTGYVFLSYAKDYIKMIARLVILINSITIFAMGLNLIIN